MLPKITTVISIVCILLERIEAATKNNCTEITTTGGTVHTQNYTSYTALDTDNIFQLYWEPPKNRSADSEINFKVEIRAKGYFGLGFSPNGGMPESDIVTGWIRDGKVYFQDRHATAYSLPPNDNRQDYELIAACENDTSTVFEFRRKLDTCDVNDMVIEESTMRIIYAYSDEDPGFDDPFYHQENRGSKSILLLQNKERVLNPDSMLYWDILAPDVHITSFETLYWCKIYKSPEVSEKQHIVYVKPMIQEGNEGFVHHMLVFECVGGKAEEFEGLVADKGNACFQPEMEEILSKCQGVFLGWAIGGQDIVLPNHVGFPIFPGPSKYYMLQIHYDNPLRRSGIIDRSGLRFYYTDNLRKFDGGEFATGASVLPRAFIPPGQKEYVVVGHSTHDCIGSAFPEGGVKAIAITPHTHLLGRAFRIRHFRGNKELKPLYVDKYYDFNYQQYQYFTEDVDILPNDQITVECTYDSTERSNVTFGGYSSKEEMCVAFIIYYPLINQFISDSVPSYASINKALNTNIIQETDIYTQLGAYDWKSVDMNEVQNILRYSEHQTQCQPGPFPAELPFASYPKDLIPYEEETMCNTSVR